MPDQSNCPVIVMNYTSWAHGKPNASLTFVNTAESDGHKGNLPNMGNIQLHKLRGSFDHMTSFINCEAASITWTASSCCRLHAHLYPPLLPRGLCFFMWHDGAITFEPASSLLRRMYDMTWTYSQACSKQAVTRKANMALANKQAVFVPTTKPWATNPTEHYWKLF